MWSKFVPANRSLLFGKQQDQERKHTQKKVVYLGNEGVTLMMLLHKGSVTSIQCINVVRCTLTQSNETDDWRRTTFFHTWIKVGDKNCKIIVDSESYINVVSSSYSPKAVPHTCPYKVSKLTQRQLK